MSQSQLCQLGFHEKFCSNNIKNMVTRLNFDNFCLPSFLTFGQPVTSTNAQIGRKHVNTARLAIRKNCHTSRGRAEKFWSQLRSFALAMSRDKLPGLFSSGGVNGWELLSSRIPTLAIITDEKTNKSIAYE